MLQVISSSAGELKPVFETMLESAVRICGAKFGNLLLVEGDAFRYVALYGAPQAYLEERRREPVIRARPGSPLDRVRRTKQIVHVADMQLEGPATPAIIELAGARTFLNVPMLKDNELIGTIGIYRQEVRPFTNKQIELVQNFAAQASFRSDPAHLLRSLLAVSVLYLSSLLVALNASEPILSAPLSTLHHLMAEKPLSPPFRHRHRECAAAQ